MNGDADDVDVHAPGEGSIEAKHAPYQTPVPLRERNHVLPNVSGGPEMGKRGPAKMPTALKVLHGETRPERLNRDAPAPFGGLPVMPRGMSPRAQTVWRRQIKSMGKTGVLTAVDGDSLRCYVEAVDRYITAAEMLAEAGPLIVGQKDNQVRHPLAQIVRDNAMLIRQFGRDLGFLPSAREGLHVVGDAERDPLADWITRGR